MSEKVVVEKGEMEVMILKVKQWFSSRGVGRVGKLSINEN